MLKTAIIEVPDRELYEERVNDVRKLYQGDLFRNKQIILIERDILRKVTKYTVIEETK